VSFGEDASDAKPNTPWTKTETFSKNFQTFAAGKKKLLHGAGGPFSTLHHLALALLQLLGQDRTGGGRTKPRAFFLIIFARNHSADEPPEMSPFYLTLMRNTAAASQQASPCAAPSIMCRPILHLHLQRCVKLSKKVLHLLLGTD